MNNVIIYGPAGCGKTRNKYALARYYGKGRVVDEFRGTINPGTRDSLLIGEMREVFGLERSDRLIPFDAAMKEACLS